MKIGIKYNECECIAKIHGECIEHTTEFIQNNSPNYDFHSKLNPFVLHGDNLFITLASNEFLNENLIAIQNCSKDCIKYEWNEVYVTDTLKIQIEPQNGYLKAGFTKLFHLSIKSFANLIEMNLIPLKCEIYRYNAEIFREYLLPDGYFEYTEHGYYEKVNFIYVTYKSP